MSQAGQASTSAEAVVARSIAIGRYGTVLGRHGAPPVSEELAGSIRHQMPLMYHFGFAAASLPTSPDAAAYGGVVAGLDDATKEHWRREIMTHWCDATGIDGRTDAAAAGGFASQPVTDSAGVSCCAEFRPTLLSTQCCLLLLRALGVEIDSWADDGSPSREATAATRSRRYRLLSFVARCQHTDGSFAADDDPATEDRDVRWTYAAAVIATMLSTTCEGPAASASPRGPPPRRRNLPKGSTLDSSSVRAALRYLSRCQTHEGGFAARPTCGEAHAGMTYCALAGGSLLSGLLDDDTDSDGEERKDFFAPRWLDRRALTQYLARRLTAGGFNGRPYKPPDTCYNYWVGAACRIIIADRVGDDAIASSLARDAAAGVIALMDLSCEHGLDQTAPTGGVAKRPGVDWDPLHNYLSAAGFAALAGWGGKGVAMGVADHAAGLP